MSTTRSRLVFALVPALVTFVVIMLALFNARTFRQSTDWVDHTSRVIERSDALLLRAIDAETGQRGYLITGDTNFLAPGRGAPADVERALLDLRGLTVDNSRQHPRLDTLAGAISAQFAALGRGIALRRAGQLDSLANGTLLREGRGRMDGIRQLVAVIKTDEQRLLGQRRALAEGQFRFATMVLLFGGLLSIVVAVVVNVLLTRIISERERMTRELGAQLDDLAVVRRELQARAASPTTS